jgi:hypothetical protein
MPPEVAQRRRDRRLQGWAIVALIAVLGLVVTGSAFGAVSNTVAQAGLLNAQAETQDLLAQQQEFGEVVKINTSIALAGQVRAATTAAEVLWLDVQQDVFAALPAGVTVTQLSASADAPWTTNLVPAGPLRSAKVATIGLTVTSATLPQLSAYVRALEALDITADATIDSTQNSNGYSATITLNISEAALSKRFTDEYVPRDTPPPVETPAPTATAEPTPDPTPTAEAEEEGE